MANYEIEIKSLIGDKSKAGQLVEKMKQADPAFAALGSHKQLNHYFVKGDLNCLREKLKLQLPHDLKNFSVRTRQADSKVILVIKTTVDDTTSANGTARQEFESEVDLTLNQLDEMLLDCGFEYQAKWSREREEYKYKGLNVTVDKNAGYGYLAEFESIIDNPALADETKSAIRECIALLGLQELPQDRLSRMFDYYNKNWQDYYGTEKTFVVD